MEVNNAEIVTRIKTMAAEKGIKLSHVASMLGVGPGYFSDCARGKNKFSQDRLDKIANLLGTTTDWLLGKTTNKKRPLEDMDLRGLTERELIALELFNQLTFEEQDAQIKLWKTRLSWIPEPPDDSE